jgi:hypothetical protein
MRRVQMKKIVAVILYITVRFGRPGPSSKQFIIVKDKLKFCEDIHLE